MLFKYAILSLLALGYLTLLEVARDVKKIKKKIGSDTDAPTKPPLATKVDIVLDPAK